MPEPVDELLSRFTPDGGGLDRAALLFAAGRASVRPTRKWLAVAGALAVSQVLTLVLLWPRTTGPASVPLAQQLPVEGTPARVAPPPQDPSAVWSLRQQLSATDDLLPVPAAAGQMVPAGPPLHAFTEIDSFTD